MKSDRFTIPATKSKVPPTLDEPSVTFDDKTGNIIYKDTEEYWSINKEGHRHIKGKIISLAGDGIISKGEIGESNGLVCYTPDEYPVEVHQANGLVVQEHIRLALGLMNKKRMLVTNDGKFYIVAGVPRAISYDCELDPVKIVQSMELLNKFNKSLGDLTDIKTNKLTLVDTINELIERVNCPRRLLGHVKFLIFSEEEIKKFIPQDMDMCFDYQKMRFMYWSEALDKWIYLPKGWQKCTNIYRHEFDMQFLDQEYLEVGETLGCLDTGKVYKWNGEIWSELAPLTDDVGDEYIVQYALVDNVLKSLTIVYTRTGWVYTLR